jgi:hypothetical protein
VAAVKPHAGLVGLGIAVALLHDRAWARLARTAASAALTLAGL